MYLYIFQIRLFLSHPFLLFAFFYSQPVYSGLKCAFWWVWQITISKFFAAGFVSKGSFRKYVRSEGREEANQNPKSCWSLFGRGEEVNSKRKYAFERKYSSQYSWVSNRRWRAFIDSSSCFHQAPSRNLGTRAYWLLRQRGQKGVKNSSNSSVLTLWMALKTSRLTTPHWCYEKSITSVEST